MPKKTKTTTKKRTQVKDLPAPTKKMSEKEKRNVRGGAVGPCFITKNLIETHGVSLVFYLRSDQNLSTAGNRLLRYASRRLGSD